VPCSTAPALQAFVDKHELAGVVALIADKDKVLSVEAVGVADIAAGKSMQPDAVFWIASQSRLRLQRRRTRPHRAPWQ
jgi:hypothetical protein